MRQTLIFSIVLFILFSCESNQDKFDRESGQKEVLTHQAVDSILAQFEQISYADIDNSYKPEFDSKIVLFGR